MSDGDSPTEPEPSINDRYTSQFRRHLAQVQGHLAGNDGKALQPSYIPPTGYWTSSEKDTFFHALSIHSRFRPDLIAASIATKSVVDVCTYIDALDEGLSRNKAVHSFRAELEGSMEVSDSWVQWEEKRSADLVSLESEWEDEIFEKQGAELVDKEGCDVDESDRDGSLRCWKQEKTLRRLDLHQLRVLENILRDGGTEIEIEPADHPGISDRPLITDDLIDPFLLELSGVSTPALPAPDISLQTSNEISPQAPPPVTPDPNSLPEIPQPDIPDSLEEKNTNLSELSPASRRRYQKRLYMRKKRAEKTGSEYVAIVTKLRPGRKTKERKPPKPRPRTYRSKNNPPEDDPDDLSMNVDDTTDGFSASAVNQDTIQNSDQEEEDDDPPEHAHRNKSGMTKPYKVKKEFASQGIDADVLMQGDLGLFHLSTLSRLMKLYKSGYDKATTPIASTISADTIRLMTAIVVEFASEVVHRTVISREQEKAMKGNIKVYGRMHDDITPENVDHVLEMMGMEGLTKAKYFADLLDEEMFSISEKEAESGDDDNASISDSQHPSNEANACADEGDEEDDDANEGESGLSYPHDTASFPALLSLRRELYPPLIHLPNPLASNNSATQESLMPLATDETELLKELEEELELDALDGILAKEYEAGLWKHSG